MSAKYKLLYLPHHPNAKANGQVYEHVYVMTILLDRALSEEEVVHHKDEDTFNNLPSNLQLFATDAEHKAHHRKQRAFVECGDSSYIKCRYCGGYDSLVNMQHGKNTYQAWHKACAAKAYKERNNGN